MAGLGFDNFFPKVISAKKHAVIDYIHAGTNFAVGALLHRKNPRAAYAAYGLGASVLFNALMTDYPLGVARVYDFKVHGILDYSVATASAVMPLVLGFADQPEAYYFYGQGAGETTIAGITDYDDESGSRRQLKKIGERYHVHRAA